MNTRHLFGTVLGVLLLAGASTVSAQNTTANAGAQSGSNAGAEAGAASQSGASVTQNYYNAGTTRTELGGGQTLTYGGGTNNVQRQIIEGGTTDRYRATIRNTPDAYAPNVSGGTNSCLVGMSGAGSVAGFGIGIGGNWSDPACERRQLAALLHNTNQPDIAQEVLCETDAVRQARARLGRPCAQDVQRAAGSTPVLATAPSAIPAPVQMAAPAPAVVQRRFPDWCYTATAAERRRYPAGTCG